MITMTTKTLLQLRRSAKKRKPDFVVKESRFMGRVKERWRLPRGRHSAARQRYRGRPAQPHPGYGSPAAVRGFSREGLLPVLVHNERELKALNPSTEGALIASTVGSKKKLSLLSTAQQNKIRVLQVKDTAALAEKIKKEVTDRQKKRHEHKQIKSKKLADKQKKSEEKEKQKSKETKASETKHDTHHGAKTESGSSAMEEEKLTEKEEERKVAEKTITKRQ